MGFEPRLHVGETKAISRSSQFLCLICTRHTLPHCHSRPDKLRQYIQWMHVYPFGHLSDQITGTCQIVQVLAAWQPCTLVQLSFCQCGSEKPQFLDVQITSKLPGRIRPEVCQVTTRTDST